MEEVVLCVFLHMFIVRLVIAAPNSCTYEVEIENISMHLVLTKDSTYICQITLNVLSLYKDLISSDGEGPFFLAKLFTYLFPLTHSVLCCTSFSVLGLFLQVHGTCERIRWAQNLYIRLMIF